MLINIFSKSAQKHSKLTRNQNRAETSNFQKIKKKIELLLNKILRISQFFIFSKIGHCDFLLTEDTLIQFQLKVLKYLKYCAAQFVLKTVQKYRSRKFSIRKIRKI